MKFKGAIVNYFGGVCRAREREVSIASAGMGSDIVNAENKQVNSIQIQRVLFNVLQKRV